MCSLLVFVCLSCICCVLFVLFAAFTLLLLYVTQSIYVVCLLAACSLLSACLLGCRCCGCPICIVCMSDACVHCCSCCFSCIEAPTRPAITSDLRCDFPVAQISRLDPAHGNQRGHRLSELVLPVLLQLHIAKLFEVRVPQNLMLMGYDQCVHCSATASAFGAVLKQ